MIRNNYFLISGYGYPRLLDKALENSISDINEVGKFSYFVICLDAEESSVEERQNEVLNRIRDAKPPLEGGVTPRVIVQNRSIETWFVGNRDVFPRNPMSETFRELVGFFNVYEHDPEQMGVMEGYRTHGEFHQVYLREMLRERGLQYTKLNPGHCGDSAYVDQLVARVTSSPEQLATFQVFLNLCRNIKLLSIPQGLEQIQ